MRKRLIVISFIMATFFLANLSVLGGTHDDYRVIKNAVKKNKGKVEIQWFKISVIDKRSKKRKVNIKLPFSLIELLANCSKDDFEVKSDCDISLKKIVKIFKKHGPMTIIEVDDDDELIKIWFE
jgi:hypothetical protein